MINWLHSRFHKPSQGWDPIAPEWARDYSNNEWNSLNLSCIDEIECWLGGFGGKRILDLGGGPGQFSVAIARRGGMVTWHDVSKSYLDIARMRAADAGVEIRWSLGYLEDAERAFKAEFDLVFNRVCWYYCRNDYLFSRIIWNVLKKDGVCYIDTNNSYFRSDSLTAAARFRIWLNSYFWIKIGHPMPPRGRIAKLFLMRPLSKMLVDYDRLENDRVIFRKAR
jgi:2-polyprenyl-3-methyl-5-hydroxy-6-metoxy-1,4-benzoquinol methylase